MMKQLKLLDQSVEEGKSSCGCNNAPSGSENKNSSLAGASELQGSMPRWATGTVMTSAGIVYTVSTDLSSADYWEHFRCRVSAFRNSYTVSPGLYAAGNPDSNSDVLVTANYKLSFDKLRCELKGINVWILVLDTKGINVWCAAGKGSFGTDELIRRITSVQLAAVVDHRRIIVPQLGAPGVSAHQVRKATGFRVMYGPVSSRDLTAYIRSGYKASRKMRTIDFPLPDRLVLTPMEINPAMKIFPFYALIILIVFGLQPTGIFFQDAYSGGMPFVALGFLSLVAGALATPVLLPFIPFRSFAVKGWITGMLAVALSMKYFDQLNTTLLVFAYIFFPLASSFIALQFTGSTTFTGMSGVKKELKFTVPVYFLAGAVSVVLLIAFKLNQWGLL